MNIHKISVFCFSPTDSSKKVLGILADSLSLPAEMIDVTNHTQRVQVRQFATDELVIFGAPVYGGRLPAPAVESMSQLKGNQTPAVLVVTYGNRDYDDALLELKHLVQANGFIPIAAAAFITEHSIMHSVARGRPDEKDEASIRLFAQKAWEKIQSARDVTEISELQVKGNMPYKVYDGVPLKPGTTKACIGCGVCAAECPVNAIPAQESDKTDTKKCISCMRCIKKCPSHVRRLNKLMLFAAEKMFARKYKIRKEPEFFM